MHSYYLNSVFIICFFITVLVQFEFEPIIFMLIIYALLLNIYLILQNIRIHFWIPTTTVQRVNFWISTTTIQRVHFLILTTTVQRVHCLLMYQTFLRT